MGSYGFSKTLDCGFEEAVEKARAGLAEKGFGILTEIDVQATLKKKLDKDFRKYVILGACNPPYAYQALTSEVEIGLLLPCNVIVYETDDGKSVVSAIDPMTAMSMVDNPSVEKVAEEVTNLLQSVINGL